jgi:Ca2+-binding EF-hand superfamily protein
MFKYFDIFDRGTVSFGDFLKTVEKIGLYYTPQELEPLFNEYDSDQSGHLDYKEFSAIIFGNRDTLKGQQIKRQPQNPNNNQE